MIICRTIFRELLKNLSVIVCCLAVILFMEKFVRLTRLFMGKGADLIDILKIFVYLQPSILLLSIPMAILICIFLTYGRMATDSETIVLKASGMSFTGLAKAAFSVSILGFSLLLFISLVVMPKSMQSFKYTLHETIVKKASMTFEAGTFSDVFKGAVIFVKEVSRPDEFSGIFVYRDPDRMLPDPVVIVAEKGAMTSNPAEGMIKLTLHNGLIHTFKETSSSQLSFEEYDFILSSGIESGEKTKPEEIATRDLWNQRKENISWDIELHRRVALPFACLIFGILGPALAVRIGRVGRLGGFSFSLVVLIFYYMLLVTGEGLAKTGRAPVFLGVWGPNMFFGVTALLFFRFAQRDRATRRI